VPLEKDGELGHRTINKEKEEKSLVLRSKGTDVRKKKKKESSVKEKRDKTRVTRGRAVGHR